MVHLTYSYVEGFKEIISDGQRGHLYVEVLDSDFKGFSESAFIYLRERYGTDIPVRVRIGGELQAQRPLIQLRSDLSRRSDLADTTFAWIGLAAFAATLFTLGRRHF